MSSEDARIRDVTTTRPRLCYSKYTHSVTVVKHARYDMLPLLYASKTTLIVPSLAHGTCL